ncbi:MAG: sugar transferase [bacterium]
MLPKLFRYFGTAIEDGITASFSDVAMERDSLMEGSLKDYLTMALQGLVKRGLDFIISGVLLLMSLPLFVVIAILIKIDTGGPVFFRQKRAGNRGKTFIIWKFSSMRQENSEDEHRQYVKYLLSESTCAEDRVDLLAGYIDYVDGRTTKIGRFLRSTSLDELPQLINIFLGDMSLVGPRPHPVYEVTEYKEWYRRRLDVKPGLTGWSKINLRCTPKNYEESILFDLWYVDHWSLGLDVRIMLKTIPFVMKTKDAH